MEEFLNPCKDGNNIMTPEALAWKLLIDDDVKDYAGVLLPSVLGDHIDNGENILYDTLADQFQILVTIYMELVFGLLKINHISSFVNDDDIVDDNIDFDATFNPNVSELTIDDMINIFREKFKKVRVFLSVRGIYDGNEKDPKNYGSSSDYYCRIILKNSPEGYVYFDKNKDWLDPEKHYTFVIRDDKKRKQKQLADFYAVFTLPNNGNKIRISFSPINVIMKTQE